MKENSPVKWTIKEFIKRVKFMSRYELEKLCRDSGMREKEVQGVLMYIYDELSAEVIAEKLNISTSQFYKKKERVAHRLRSYLKSINYSELDLV